MCDKSSGRHRHAPARQLGGCRKSEAEATSRWRGTSLAGDCILPYNHWGGIVAYRTNNVVRLSNSSVRRAGPRSDILSAPAFLSPRPSRPSPHQSHLREGSHCEFTRGLSGRRRSMAVNAGELARELEELIAALDRRVPRRTSRRGRHCARCRALRAKAFDRLSKLLSNPSGEPDLAIRPKSQVRTTYPPHAEPRRGRRLAAMASARWPRTTVQPMGL